MKCKNFFSISFILVIIFSMVVGCRNNKDQTAAPEEKQDVKTVKIFQFKIEITEQMNALKKEYEAAHPGVKLEIETVGGGSDYAGALRAKIAAGEEPDIFNNEGFAQLMIWQNQLEDLSDQPWVSELVEGAGDSMKINGKIYGMPMNIEGYGFLYNKDLFAKAGIKKLPTTLPELESAAKKLQAVGITPFCNAYQEVWVLGMHNLNAALANQPDPNQFIQQVLSGKQSFKDNKVFKDWVNLLDLTVKYGNKSPLTTDYNMQVTEFASGKAAMMQQGNWTQVQISKLNPNIKIGVLPMPISAKKNNKIFVGVSSNWVINKNSSVKKEAKEFLNWLVFSETGKKFIVKELKFIPAFKNIAYTSEDLGDIAASIQEYTQESRVLGWNWPKLPERATVQMGSAMQSYITGEISKEQMLQKFDEIIYNLVNE